MNTRKIIGWGAAAALLLMAAQQTYHVWDSPSGGTVDFGISAGSHFPVQIAVDDAGYVLLSNPGSVTLGDDAGLSVTSSAANIQDAGVAFNNVIGTVGGKAVNGLALPLAVDDAGAILLSNPGGGNVTVIAPVTVTNGDAGSLNVAITSGGVSGPVTVTIGDAGNLPVTIQNAVQIYDDGGGFIVAGQTASGTKVPLLVSSTGAVITASRTSMTPQAPAHYSIPGDGGSAEASSLPGGGCVQVYCNVAVGYQFGADPVTTTYTAGVKLPGPNSTMIKCLTTTQNALAFSTNDAVNVDPWCEVSILNTPQ